VHAPPSPTLLPRQMDTDGKGGGCTLLSTAGDEVTSRGLANGAAAMKRLIDKAAGSGGGPAGSGGTGAGGREGGHNPASLSLHPPAVTSPTRDTGKVSCSTVAYLRISPTHEVAWDTRMRRLPSS